MKTSYKKITPLLLVGLATISLDTFAGDTSATPFDIKPLNNGYQLAANEEGKNGQSKIKQGSCGEGKCGNNKTDSEAVCGIYQIGTPHNDDSKLKDGKCGGHKVVESLCGEG